MTGEVSTPLADAVNTEPCPSNPPRVATSGQRNFFEGVPQVKIQAIEACKVAIEEREVRINEVPDGQVFFKKLLEETNRFIKHCLMQIALVKDTELADQWEAFQRCWRSRGH